MIASSASFVAGIAAWRRACFAIALGIAGLGAPRVVRAEGEAAVATASASSVSSASASAPVVAAAPELPARFAWDPARPRVRPIEIVATGALLGGVILLVVEDRYRAPLWKGGILFDDAFRSAFRAKSEAGRRRAQEVGTDLYVGSFFFSAADALVSAWAVHGSADVAEQLLLMDTEAYALVGFLQFLAAATVRRERPYQAGCRQGIDEGFPGCSAQNADGSKSFFAGHVAIAATNAGLTCAHHTHMDLYGDYGDGGVCALTIASTFVVAYTRMAADKHYASDIVAGMLIGGTAGYLLPTWLHYRKAATEGDARASIAPRIVGVMPMATPTSVTASLLGIF